MDRKLPDHMPIRIQRLPVQKSFPVPWFVDQVNGEYDFRIMDGRKLPIAVKEKRCWICGDRLGKFLSFTIGPMCVINRMISEPPSHTECAKWSIKACPFLNQSEVHRRDTDLPQEAEEPAGHMIKRQPGAICLWTTFDYQVRSENNGFLFRIGDPQEILWYCKGRFATRAEVLESIDSGYPLLLEAAEKDGEVAVELLTKAKAMAMAHYLPK